MHFNPLNTELNPICHLLALLGAHHILHVSGVKVNIYILFAIVSSTAPTSSPHRRHTSPTHWDRTRHVTTVFINPETPKILTPTILIIIYS
jgi:hypothetical protein